MVSYFKTQWWRIICCLLCIAYAIHFAAQPAGPDSIEGLGQDIGNIVSCLTWFLLGLVWAIMSMFDYYGKRLSLLEKKAEKYDAMYDLVQELLEANKIDRQYAAHLNRKIDSFIVDHKKKEKQK